MDESGRISWRTRLDAIQPLALNVFLISEASDGTAYDTDYIRTELKRLGFVSGPIAGTTKKLYLKKLRRIRKSVPDLEAPLIKPG